MAKKTTTSLPRLDLRSLPGPDNITRVTLDNGITVLARENFHSPAVVLDGALQAGSIYEGRSKAGLASFTASALMRGAANYSFEEIYERIEPIGAHLSTGSGTHTAGFDGKSLAEDLETLLELAADVLRRPTFPEDHIERLRGEYLTGLAMRAHDTRAMAGLTFYETLYGDDHPYGYSGSGYPDTVQAITRDDIVAFHRRHYGPRGMLVVIVGAVAAQEAVALVEKYFGDWRQPDQPERAAVPAVEPPAEVTRRMIPLAGKTQSDLVLGFLGPARADADFQAARLANSILGVFGMMGRLGDNVRNKQGLAYYSYSGLESRFGRGAWRLIAGVNPANVERAVEGMLAEVRRMVTRKVTAAELADNKAFMLGRIPLQLETNEGVAGTIANMEQHALGLDYLQRLPDQIASISRDDLLAAAQNYLDPDRYVLSIAGPEAITHISH
ncbi:MAG: M16 family metallopeptidase [Anaerolineales bacterium]